MVIVTLIRRNENNSTIRLQLLIIFGIRDFDYVGIHYFQIEKRGIL